MAQAETDQNFGGRDGVKPQMRMRTTEKKRCEFNDAFSLLKNDVLVILQQAMMNRSLKQPAWRTCA